MSVTVSAAAPDLYDGALLGYPRYKLCVHPTDPQHLYIVFGNGGSGVVDTYHSTDGGATWTGLGTNQWDYHVNLSVCQNGYLHTGTRRPYDTGDARYRRYTTSWQTEITLADDFTDSCTAHALAHGASDVWVFVRDSHNLSANAGRIYAYRSTDSGATFGSGTLVYTATSTTYKRIGSCIIADQPALLVWEQDTSVCHMRIFRFNGSSWAAIANDPLDTTSQNAETRDWCVTECTDGTIHCSWKDILSGSNYVLRHAYRSLAGSWSTPTTYVDIADNTEGYASLCARGEELYSAYIRSNGSYLAAHYRRWTLGGGWGSEVTISAQGDGDVHHYVQVPQKIPASHNVLPIAWCVGETGWVNKTVLFDSISLPSLSPVVPRVFGLRN